MNSILDLVIEIGLNALLGGIGGGGGLGSLFGGLFGFAGGGYTGNGGRNEPAGVVHKGEYVFTKAQTERLGVGNLSRLARGYANGGLVGAPGPVAPRPVNQSGALAVHVSLNSDMLHAEVVNTAAAVVTQAAPAIIKRANDSAADAVMEQQARNGSSGLPFVRPLR